MPFPNLDGLGIETLLECFLLLGNSNLFWRHRRREHFKKEGAWRAFNKTRSGGLAGINYKSAQHPSRQYGFYGKVGLTYKGKEHHFHIRELIWFLRRFHPTNPTTTEDHPFRDGIRRMPRIGEGDPEPFIRGETNRETQLMEWVHAIITNDRPRFSDRKGDFGRWCGYWMLSPLSGKFVPHIAGPGGLFYSIYLPHVNNLEEKDFVIDYALRELISPSTLS